VLRLVVLWDDGRLDPHGGDWNFLFTILQNEDLRRPADNQKWTLILRRQSGLLFVYPHQEKFG
jgi:hypothetical protein